MGAVPQLCQQLFQLPSLGHSWPVNASVRAWLHRPRARVQTLWCASSAPCELQEQQRSPALRSCCKPCVTHGWETLGVPQRCGPWEVLRAGVFLLQGSGSLLARVRRGVAPGGCGLCGTLERAALTREALIRPNTPSRKLQEKCFVSLVFWDGNVWINPLWKEIKKCSLLLPPDAGVGNVYSVFINYRRQRKRTAALWFYLQGKSENLFDHIMTV